MTVDQTAYSIRTDLAVESRELAEPDISVSLPGVVEEVEQVQGMKITKIHVQTDEGARALGRLPGRYLTIEAPGLRHKDSQFQHKVARELGQRLSSFLQEVGIGVDEKVLIVGLGNWNVTPDALGPLVVENVLVTRHYFKITPDQVHSGYRLVSAVAPGVLGVTGIESSEIVQGIVERTKPDVVIAIDALAAKALERVNTTIQIADTGIIPGSGIGNKRRGLTKDILGIPCLAIGVPTVCYASTIVNNAFDYMKNHFKQETADTKSILGMLDVISEQERLLLVKEVLEPLGHDLVVTPKEVDEFIEDMANIIASGLNEALHAAVNMDNVSAYTH